MDLSRLEFCSDQQQAFVLDDTSPTLLYSGAFAAGKSIGLCLRAIFTAANYPGSRIGLFRKTRRSLTSTTLETFQQVCPPEWIKEYNKTDLRWTLLNDSRIEGYGLDEETKVRGLELTDAGVDEIVETSQKDWLTLNSRVGRWKRDRIHKRGQLYGATNPGTPTHYLYDFFFRKGLGRVIETEMIDNEFLAEDVLARASLFTGLFYERFIRGRWISMEGLIYDEFGPHNVVNAQDVFPGGIVPPTWYRYAGIDFGYVNPFVHLWAAENDGRLYLYRELYMSHRIVEDHARQIKAMEVCTPWIDGMGNERKNERVLSRWADHYAEDRATLSRYGVGTTPATKDISPGIQAVKRYLRPDETGRPRLMIVRGALIEKDSWLQTQGFPTCLLDEIGSYVMRPSVDGRANKEEPVDLNNHALDAVRYLVMGHEVRPRISPFTFSTG